MPELHWSYGYPAALTAMGITAIGLLIYFYRRGWILRGQPPASRSSSGQLG
jgi:magnesium transporter